MKYASIKTGTVGVIGAIALACSAAPANAAVFIALQQAGVNNGDVTQVSTGPGAALLTLGYGTFELMLTYGVAGAPPELLSSGITAQNSGTGGSLDVYVTQNDINLGNYPGVSFTTNFPAFTLATGWSLTRTSFVDFTNQLFGGTQLSQDSSNGLTALSDVEYTSLISNPFSVTHKYSITAPNSGFAPTTLSSSMATFAAVPEPSSWVMMIAGFMGMGAMIRFTRSRKSMALKF